MCQRLGDGIVVVDIKTLRQCRRVLLVGLLAELPSLLARIAPRKGQAFQRTLAKMAVCSSQRALWFACAKSNHQSSGTASLSTTR